MLDVTVRVSLTPARLPSGSALLRLVKLCRSSVCPVLAHGHKAINSGAIRISILFKVRWHSVAGLGLRLFIYKGVGSGCWRASVITWAAGRWSIYEQNHAKRVCCGGADVLPGRRLEAGRCFDPVNKPRDP